jgi:hypothetical protein
MPTNVTRSAEMMFRVNRFRILSRKPNENVLNNYTELKEMGHIVNLLYIYHSNLNNQSGFNIVDLGCWVEFVHMLSQTSPIETSFNLFIKHI